jgi:hypothetical protein
MFSTFDCAVKGYRQKEDAWNAIISGFMTGGCLAARSESCSPACHFHVPRSNFRKWGSDLVFSMPCIPSIFNPLLTFHFPGGPKAAFGSAVACGILLGVFEGVGVLLGRVFSEGTRPQLPPCASHFFACSCPTLTRVSSFSTRVHVSTDVIFSCYLILIIPDTLIRIIIPFVSSTLLHLDVSQH